MPFDSPLVPLCKNEHLLDKGRKIARAERVKKRNSRQLEDSTRRISPIRWKVVRLVTNEKKEVPLLYFLPRKGKKATLSFHRRG